MKSFFPRSIGTHLLILGILAIVPALPMIHYASFQGKAHSLCESELHIIPHVR
jgi:hypothetical protein